MRGTAPFEPFRIEIPQNDLDDLHDRLARTRWPDPLPGERWSNGMPVEYARELADYWRTGFDWRAVEAELNSWSHFLTEIDGQRVHFIHAPSAKPGALPLLITHGWPGSVVEFLDVLRLLTKDFHVVAPSLPGFGFSTPPTAGWGVKRIANAWAELMTRLGYRRFVAQGGDWGSAVTRSLSLNHPDHVVAVHYSTLMHGIPAEPKDLQGLTDAELGLIESGRRFAVDGVAYAQIQHTRPQTVSYALADSPVAQMTWIGEKFYEWTDNDGSPEDAISRDRMLANIAFYWFTGTGGSSAQIYAAQAGARGSGPRKAEVPAAVAVFPAEIRPPIRRFAERENNIVRWTEFERGGHFASLEVPDLLAGDIQVSFSEIA
ncbi:epoxide hydrolase 1 [Mycobacterium sp. CBMA271]|uniref:epoxide hydrolase family protein n=1 Tax=unclassified Mycobacteroides TaxID=2618759 RepID=UPI0012DFE5B6|nr:MULTISPECIES: epoxide hydrolase family protein [unclassified Mycobacteroides]MUM15553.1 epoxide hydrolase [Mycobacteroides sp. CBMA 326]MUM17348.1 epoxide hydrolase [Mycobacteroides sp. CBMA 326]MUM21821.1 epoxide hydrolase 1 [Mycobacteroides sp. CBMA 271]